MWLKPSTTLINGVETDLQIAEMLLEGVKKLHQSQQTCCSRKTELKKIAPRLFINILHFKMFKLKKKKSHNSTEASKQNYCHQYVQT